MLAWSCSFTLVYSSCRQRYDQGIWQQISLARSVFRPLSLKRTPGIDSAKAPFQFSTIALNRANCWQSENYVIPGGLCFYRSYALLLKTPPGASRVYGVLYENVEIGLARQCFGSDRGTLPRRELGCFVFGRDWPKGGRWGLLPSMGGSWGRVGSRKLTS